MLLGIQENISGIDHLIYGPMSSMAQFQMEINRNYMDYFGFQPQDVGILLQTAFSPYQLSEYIYKDHCIPITLTLKNTYRNDFNHLQKLSFHSPLRQTFITLGQLTQTNIEPRELSIVHQQGTVTQSIYLDVQDMSIKKRIKDQLERISQVITDHYQDIQIAVESRDIDLQKRLWQDFKQLAIILITLWMIFAIYYKNFFKATAIILNIMGGLILFIYTFTLLYNKIDDVFLITFSLFLTIGIGLNNGVLITDWMDLRLSDIQAKHFTLDSIRLKKGMGIILLNSSIFIIPLLIMLLMDETRFYSLRQSSQIIIISSVFILLQSMLLLPAITISFMKAFKTLRLYMSNIFETRIGGEESS